MYIYMSYLEETAFIGKEVTKRILFLKTEFKKPSISSNLGMKLDGKVVHTRITQISETSHIDKWKRKKSFNRNYFLS